MPLESRNKQCRTCSAWSELVAKCEGGGPVLALCLNPASLFHGKYTAGYSACTAWSDDPALADHPSQRAPAAGVSHEITRRSPISGEFHTLTLTATEDQWAAYTRGELIQRALPHLSDAEREFLKTGITDEEWHKTFPPDDEDL